MRELVIAELRSRGYHVRESHIPNELNICCPFCSSKGKTADVDFKLGLNTANGKAHCFRCGWRSRDALTQLKVFVPGESLEAEAQLALVELPEDFEILDGDSTDYWMKKAVKYVRNRGVTLHQAVRHQVGFCMTGKFRARVVFPIHQNEKLVGYTARALMPSQQPKWLHSDGLRSVYPAQWGRKREIILVEGVMDALVVERWLGRQIDVVALLGTHLTDHKMVWLERYRKITLWLDADWAGRSAVVEIASALCEDGRIVQVVRAVGDPSDLPCGGILSAYGARRRWTEGEGLSLLSG